MKTMLATLMFTAVTLAATAARADGEPENTCVLPAGTDMACVASCFKGSNPAPAVEPVQPTCGCTTDVKVNKRLSTLAWQYRQLKKEITEQKQVIVRLEGEVGLLGKRTSDLERQMADAKRKLGELSEQLDRNTQSIVLLIGDVDALKGDIDGLKKSVGELDGDLKSLTKRVEALESKIGSPVKIGPHVGFLVMRSLDGTTFTGGTFGARLTLVLTNTVSINVDTDAVVSGGSNPMGTRVRGGLNYQLAKWISLDGGVSTTWVGYDDRLKAKSNFTTVDLGLTVIPIWKLEIGANLLLGAEFDQDKPSFAYGGLLEVRLPLP